MAYFSRLNIPNMKLASYLHNGHEQLALLVGDFLFDTDALHPELPSSMNMFLNYWEDCYPLAMNCNLAIQDGRISTARGIPADGVEWLAPVPLPVSVRVAMAAGESDGANNGLLQLRSADHQLVRGPGELPFMPDHLGGLIASFAVAAVVARAGRNIPAEEAGQHIAGLIALTNFNTPTFQHGEVTLALGPCMLTPDEWTSMDIPLTAQINGTTIGTASLTHLPFTLDQLVERASYGRDLFPGDIITAPLNIQTDAPLQVGDVVEFGFEGYEVLKNVVVADESDFSIRL